MSRKTARARVQRCAIYTRKSSEEGLEQDFNSLDAQREACEAFVLSQKHEGWEFLPERYDDGGISGGTMERPALRRLLEQIEAGEIDVVVVYKVDRLTRSLSDFARIVDIFDRHAVSFVSVTQAFNTTTSMGRLTLNVLLSFAQFEREVTGERIRDKIAASKKKGMWMGGFVPLGYDAQDRSLVINTEEAETVRTIFQLYLELKNVRLVQGELEARNLTTKRTTTASGKVIGGRPFARGHIYRILSNPIYIGEILHKGTRYPGQHAPIIDPEVWTAVQTMLQENSRGTRTRTNSREPSLLAGLLFDENGERFTATHAVNNSKRYRYYLRRGGGAGCLRIPAFEMEAAVANAIIALLSDSSQLIERLTLEETDPENLKSILARARQVTDEIQCGTAVGKRALFKDLVERIAITPDRLRIKLRRNALLARLPDTKNGSNANEADDSDGAVMIDCPITFTRRGAETRLILNGAGTADDRAPDAALIKAVALGHMWFEALASGRYKSTRDFCRHEKVGVTYVRRLLRLAFISPAIVKQVLDGNQPPGLTRESLMAWDALPMSWEGQVSMFCDGPRA